MSEELIRKIKQEPTLKQLIVEQTEELQTVKYSLTRLANSIEQLDVTIKELIATNQLLMAKLKDKQVEELRQKVKDLERRKQI